MSEARNPGGAGSGDSGKSSGSLISRIWGALWRPARTCSLGTLLIVGTVIGILFWGGVNTGLEYTNRQEFCISCHEMRTTVYEEYKKTAHYNNRTGTQATCSDCHVPTSKTPGDYTRKFVRKIEAARDVWGHLVGTIDTPEKFEAHRLTMAKREWARMKAADSKECRNCHDMDRMLLDQQKQRARRQHEAAVEDKQTCIDCHKGVAHKPIHKDLEDEGAGEKKA